MKEKIEKIKKEIKKDEYSFLNDDIHLGKNIIMLGLGGSYAYGTDNENSDIDIRGIATNSRKEILLGQDFEQVVHTETDTTIYSVRKMIHLLCACNPNIIEILGLEPWQVLKTSPIWKKILENKDIFLSKICINSFGGYANAQLRRLETKSAREQGQAQREKYIMGSIENAEQTFLERYKKMPEDSIKLYVDDTEREGFKKEIFINASLNHYPFRDFASLMNDYHSVITGYDKIGMRNKKAIEHGKLGKHMMHLVRLYLMVFDILEEGVIKTYRDKEHDFLMDIRNGKYLGEDGSISPEFYEIVDEFDARLKKDSEKTALPDKYDQKKAEKLLMDINEMVLSEPMAPVVKTCHLSEYSNPQYMACPKCGINLGENWMFHNYCQECGCNITGWLNRDRSDEYEM